MERLRRNIFFGLSALSMAVFIGINVYADTAVPVKVDSFINNGRYYVVKTYTLTAEENINDIEGKSFEENGVVYNQSDIKITPLQEIEKKEVTLEDKIAVSSQDVSQVLLKAPPQKDYQDDEGFTGILLPDASGIVFEISKYTTKTYQKDDSKYYYNLPSMDMGNISKTITTQGVTLNLVDVQWINSNNTDGGETSVGNSYTAQAFYSGTYTGKIPSGYTAIVPYHGEAQRQTDNGKECKVTYEGEKIDLPDLEDFQESNAYNKGSILAIAAFISSVLLILVYYLIRKIREKKNES